jgi:hypothetical protein
VSKSLILQVLCLEMGTLDCPKSCESCSLLGPISARACPRSIVMLESLAEEAVIEAMLFSVAAQVRLSLYCVCRRKM